MNKCILCAGVTVYFQDFIPYMAKQYDFQYELVQYKWPRWLNQQKEKQRIIWGYKILFLDVLFPLHVKKIIFVDADQVMDIISNMFLDLMLIYGNVLVAVLICLSLCLLHVLCWYVVLFFLKCFFMMSTVLIIRDLVFIYLRICH